MCLKLVISNAYSGMVPRFRKTNGTMDLPKMHSSIQQNIKKICLLPSEVAHFLQCLYNSLIVNLLYELIFLALHVLKESPEQV